MSNFKHCLHPVETEYLIKRLYERTSINLVGKIENGRSRILEDIQKCSLQGVKVVLVNMKVYKKSYEGFIRELNQQMGFKGKTAPKDLTAWMHKITSKKQKTYVLLGGFDYLLGDIEIDAKYRNQIFVDKINSLKNHSYISLVCATTVSHSSSYFYIDTEQITSPFLLEEYLMPSALSYEKIRDELDRQLEGNEYWEQLKKQDDRGQYFTFIQKHSQTYSFLKHVAYRVQLQSVGEKKIAIGEKLYKWDGEFQEVKSPDLGKRVVKAKEKFRKFSQNIKSTSKEVVENPLSSSDSTSKGKTFWGLLFLIALLATIYFIMQSNIFGSLAAGLVAAVTLFNQGLGLINQIINYIFKK